MQDHKLIYEAKKLPQRPGVYFYKNEDGKVLYIGKALSLRDRVTSYFQNDISSKTVELLHHADSISYIETGSEFEALLLEARLIKLYKPRYNIALRDDKSYLYIFISTGEEYPKVFLTRKPKSLPAKLNRRENYEGLKGEYFGPFPSGRSCAQILRWLRRIIPFCQQKTQNKRPCFYSHIGQCYPCPSYIVKQPESAIRLLKKEYRTNIFLLRKILAGSIELVTRDLEKEMRTLSKDENFEAAARIRNQIQRLVWLFKNSPHTGEFLSNPNFYFEKQQEASALLVNTLQRAGMTIQKSGRIECFDVSTLQGNYSVASQVVFINGVPEKAWYRRYRIKIDGKPNDVAMLTEAIGRRLKHPEWGMPDLVVVDGGKPQVSTISKLLKERPENIALIGIAKRLERIVVLNDGIFKELALSRKNPGLQLIQQLRDEAHRFALKYNRKRREKNSPLE